MKYIDADQIRAEIERRKKGNMYDELPMTIGRYYEDRDLLAFLDSIQERPVIKKSNALFDECVKNCDPAVMKEVSDTVDKMLGRQPVEGLEEEVRKYLTDNFTSPGEESVKIEDAAYTLWFDDVCHLARHFAEWGAKHTKK